MNDGDTIIDQSTAQKDIRLASMKTELGLMGYSVVRTDWLNALMDIASEIHAALTMEMA